MVDENVRGWEALLNAYNYSANLYEYKDKNLYPGFFKAKIDGNNILEFQNKFRKIVEEDSFDLYPIIGEVSFWKLFNFSSQIRDNNTQKILEKIREKSNFEDFTNSLKKLTETKKYEDFCQFRKVCNQNYGFAVPITFLSFYQPDIYPMADSKIAIWWNNNKAEFGCNNEPEFIISKPVGSINGWNNAGDNWNTYLKWADFARSCANELSQLSHHLWTARNVEMAIFYAQSSYEKSNIDSLKIPSIDNKINNFSNLNSLNISESERKCPRCNSSLVQHRSQKTGELYWGCTNYPKCKYNERSH